MHFHQSLVYGLIQGLAEFLPISSSAHLVLVPFFTGWEDPGLAFDVALHWGTLIAAVIYFRNDLIAMTAGFFGSLRGEREIINRLPWHVIAATIPGALLGFVFEKKAETLFRSPALVAGTLSIMGLGLYIADRIGRKTDSLEELNLPKALLIGFSQGLAIVPGISRSGITITMALLLGLDRESSVRFSFFLSIPIIFGAGLLKCKYLIQNIGDPSIIVAILSSMIFGWIAIAVLIRYVKTKSFLPFVVYRFALAAVVVACLVIR